MLVFLAATLGLFPVLAHGTIDRYLQRTVLCLDEASAQVYLGAEGLMTALERETLEAELEALLRTSLENHQVPLRVEASCDGSESYVLLTAEVVAMQSLPGELAFVFDLQVGRHAAREHVARYYELPDLRFYELATGRVEGALRGQATDFARGASRTLAAAWWEDNPPQAAQPFAAALALLAVAAAALGSFLGYQAVAARWRRQRSEARP